MDVILRMTGQQHAEIKSHLFPGDGKEAVAVALCGRRHGQSRHCLLVQQVICIPHHECRVREADQLSWPTERLVPILERAAKENLAVVKIHSHPADWPRFSEQDDRADRDLFTSVTGWVESSAPHASAIMLSDGRILGRCIMPDLSVSPLALVAVAGADIHLWFADAGRSEATFSAPVAKNAQTFGEGTVNLLGRLSVAIVGCSGTGSPVVEQVARLGVGQIVLADPDVVEAKNLNRILNATLDDARMRRPKVEVMSRAIHGMGFTTEVISLQQNLLEPDVVRRIAECDVVIGCMDGHEGRYTLNKLATYYLLPYIDVGIHLDADGHGGVDGISGSVHYLEPGCSSLISRRAVDLEKVRAEGLLRTNPHEYDEQRKAKYIAGADEERPAVISVNMLAASLAVNELLARLHLFRYVSNASYATTRFDLAKGLWIHEPEESFPRCAVLGSRTGRGDVNPLLDMPYLSEVAQCAS